MEPRQDQLSKTAGMMKAVVCKVMDKAVSSHLGKLVAVWVDVASTTCNLISTNAQLNSACLDSDLNHFFQQNGVEKLKVCMSLRSKLASLESKLENLQENTPEDSGPCAQEDICDLFCIQIPDSIKTELTSKSFDDLAAHHVSTLLSKIDKRDQSLIEAIQERKKVKDPDSTLESLDWLLQWASGSTADWTRFATETAEPLSLDQLLEEGQKTIWKLPATTIKAYCGDVEKDTGEENMLTTMPQ